MGSKDIRLSPKYGANPTIPVCFWCGEDRGEIALMGHIGDGRKGEDFEAPNRMVMDYEPCEKCRQNMSMGFTLMEATNEPNAASDVPMKNGVYPTGRFLVIKHEAAQRIFPDAVGINKAFADKTLFEQLMPDG